MGQVLGAFADYVPRHNGHSVALSRSVCTGGEEKETYVSEASDAVGSGDAEGDGLHSGGNVRKVRLAGGGLAGHVNRCGNLCMNEHEQTTPGSVCVCSAPKCE